MEILYLGGIRPATYEFVVPYSILDTRYTVDQVGDVVRLHPAFWKYQFSIERLLHVWQLPSISNQYDPDLSFSNWLLFVSPLAGRGERDDSATNEIRGI